MGGLAPRQRRHTNRGGLDVVDIDSPAAQAALFHSIDEAREPRIVVKTARGWHLWFASSGLSSRAGVLEGVDVRGLGGYVVAPPSVHPDGWHYQFLDESSDELHGVLPDRPLLPAPPWLIERLVPAARESRRQSAPIRLSGSHYARVALDSECAALAATPQGSRNHRLNAAAFSLGTLVGARVLDASDVRAHLLDAALRGGLGEREALGTIASGMSAGKRQPRQIGEVESMTRQPRREQHNAQAKSQPVQHSAAEQLASLPRSESYLEEDGPFGPVEPSGQAVEDDPSEVFDLCDDDALGPYEGYEAEWSAGAASHPGGLEI